MGRPSRLVRASQGCIGATEVEILAALGAAAELAARWQRVEVGRGMHVDWPSA